jgi:flagellar basal body rod protein FlgG
MDAGRCPDTRNGQFMLDKSSRLVTMSGEPVMGKGRRDHHQCQRRQGDTHRGRWFHIPGKGLVDTIKVVEFKDMKGLKPVSKSNFSTPERGGGDAESVLHPAGFLRDLERQCCP